MAGCLPAAVGGPFVAAGWYLAAIGAVVVGGALGLELATHAFFANTLGGNTHQPFDLLTFQYNLARSSRFRRRRRCWRWWPSPHATSSAICWR